MTEPTREQLITRITEAIDKAAADKANNGIDELEAGSEYFGLSGIFADGASDLAEVVYPVVQVALSNAHYWRDLAREERDRVQRELSGAKERIKIRDETIGDLRERIRKVREIAEADGTGCGCHGEMCWGDPKYGADIRDACCGATAMVDAKRILAVLDGEGEKADG